jgi:hypothetical protein
MKRFIVFGYDTYYPAGAFNDMIGDFDTLEEAKKCGEEDRSDWHDIFDMASADIISLVDGKWNAETKAPNAG